MTVVALLDNGEATLKKFYREAARIRLQPANPDFSPIYADNVSIQGVVVGVIRKF
jgi:repressor LexA